MCTAAFVAALVGCRGLVAQDEVDSRDKGGTVRTRGATATRAKNLQSTATIHWQRVPLRDALSRLHGLFNERVFVDRRIDPGTRVSLDIEASSADEVVSGIASGRGWGVAKLGSLVYLGPSGTAAQLRAIVAARSQEIGRLPADVRAPLTQKQATEWPRLAEPRRLITSIIEQRGWRLANAEAIPHDLWSAGELPALTFAEQLTVLLVGFDLSFELRPDDREIVVAPLKVAAQTPGTGSTSKRTAPPSATHSKKDEKHVYTLRVKEQPVGAVLRQLSKSLQWPVEIDEEGIRKAGKSLDTRVSFSVERADRDQLLEALLKPAGLEFRIDGDRVRIVAERYGDK